MRTAIFLISIALISVSCDTGLSFRSNESSDLIEVDKEFSDYATAHGIRKAFLDYADSAAVLLKPEMMPVKGLMSIRNYYQNVDESSLSLSWVPLDAMVSRSNDMGYTYGIWNLSLRDSSAQGTYVTIWKKDANGNWKYVLDSGNEGLGYSQSED